MIHSPFWLESVRRNGLTRERRARLLHLCLLVIAFAVWLAGIAFIIFDLSQP